LPNGVTGVEFHHEHRILYKSFPEHHDHLYKCIGSDGRLNRIVVSTEFFCRQSVMPFVDCREQCRISQIEAYYRIVKECFLLWRKSKTMCLNYYIIKVRRKGDNVETEEKKRNSWAALESYLLLSFKSRHKKWNDMLWHKARMMNDESSSC
jgi:hypothetical protein